MNCKHGMNPNHCYDCKKINTTVEEFNVNCDRCEGTTIHRQISQSDYECLVCGKRQENVRHCANCIELTEHQKDIISDNCKMCGNNPEDQIESRIFDDKIDKDEPVDFQKGIRRDDVLKARAKVTECMHGLYYDMNPCQRCKFASNSGGGYSTTRKAS